MLSSPVTQSSGSFSALPCGWRVTSSLTSRSCRWVRTPTNAVVPSLFRGSGGFEGQVERFRHGLVPDLAARDIEAGGEVRIGPHRGLGAQVGKLEREGQ